MRPADAGALWPPSGAASTPLRSGPSYGNAEERLGPALEPYRRRFPGLQNRQRSAAGEMRLLDRSSACALAI
jgi:hypothetical protein